MVNDSDPQIIYPDVDESEDLLELNIGVVETKELFEPEIEPITLVPTFEQRVAILENLKKMDITIGAVVVKRSLYPTTRIMPLHWGIVNNMISYLHDQVHFKPYMVKWTNGTTSHHSYEELILVNYAPDQDDLNVIQAEPYEGELKNV